MEKAIKYLILIPLFFFLTFSSFSQSRTSDSLRKALQNSRTPSGIINTYIAIARNCNEYDSAIYYVNKGIKYCSETQNTFGEATILCSMARISADFSELEDGLKWCNRAIKAGSKATNDTLLAKTYLVRGYIYFSMADNLNCGSDYHSALTYAERAGNKRLVGAAYNVLGLNFSNKKPPDTDKALEYYYKAEKIDREVKSMRDLGFVLLRIGWVHVNKGKYDLAKPYLEEALKIGDSLKIVEVQKWTLEAYASMYKNMKDYDKALVVFQKSLKISVENQDRPGLVNSMAYIADIYNKKGDFKQAMLYSDSAIKTCLKYKIFSALHHAYKGKSGIYEAMGDDKNALKFYKKATKLKDSIFKKENSENLNELEKKYETAKKEKELNTKSAELLVQKTENEKQQAQRNGFIIGTILLLILLLFIFRGYKQKKKAGELIALQKTEVEKQKQIIEEKQKEVMDSINYAKKIQTAHLPNEKYITKKMEELRKK